MTKVSEDEDVLNLSCCFVVVRCRTQLTQLPFIRIVVSITMNLTTLPRPITNIVKAQGLARMHVAKNDMNTESNATHRNLNQRHTPHTHAYKTLPIPGMKKGIRFSLFPLFSLTCHESRESTVAWVSRR